MVRKFLSKDSEKDEALIELKRARRRVPFATPSGGCLEGGDPVRFYSWKKFSKDGYPMPPIGYVVQSTGGYELEAKCYRTGKTCRLEPIWNPRKQRNNYAWFDKEGRISF